MSQHEEAMSLAVKAAARALRAAPWDSIEQMAEAAVDAAAPILLAAERARIAAAIRRLGETPQSDGALVLPLHPIVLDFIEAAARIAETAPEEGP